jgi:outer membrane protein assembly factor BamD
MHKKFFYILISLVIIGCSSKNDSNKGKTAAKILFESAQNLIKNERYLVAIEKLNQIKSLYPYSYYATPSELLLADVSFMQENYIEAAGQYEVFKELHPNYKELDYVLWKIAESYYKQMPETFDRDLSPGVKGVKVYKELLIKYPGSKYKVEVKNRLSVINKMLQNKARYIADFYYRTESYSAARFRYIDIAENYKNPELVNYAKFKIVKSSFMMKSYSDCVKYANEFVASFNETRKKELNSLKVQCLKEFNKL